MAEIFAFAGKGGVGKTTISGMLIQIGRASCRERVSLTV